LQPNWQWVKQPGKP